MDPIVVVLVVGLSGFVSDGSSGNFYVMNINDKAVHHLLTKTAPEANPKGIPYKHTAHEAKYTYFDGTKYRSEKLTDDFEISLPGSFKDLDEEGAVIVARGTDLGLFDPNCIPSKARADCMYNTGTARIPLVDLVGTIHNGTAKMVPFISAAADVADWSWTKEAKPAAFVDYYQTDRRLTQQANGKGQLDLGDAFSVESAPVTGRDKPQVKVGTSEPILLGLVADCTRWTGTNQPCYPLIVSNVSPPTGQKLGAPWKKIPAHTFLVVADPHIDALYELLKAKTRRAVPVNVVDPHGGDPPYKCRPGGIVVKP